MQLARWTKADDDVILAAGVVLADRSIWPLPCHLKSEIGGANRCNRLRATIDTHKQTTYMAPCARSVHRGECIRIFVRVDGRSQTIAPICGCEKCDIVTNSRLAHFATDFNVS